MPPLQAQILNHFVSKHQNLSSTFITSALDSIRPAPTTCSPPLLSKIQSIFFATPLQQSAAPTSYLPGAITEKHNITIPGPTLVQILHVQDIAISRIAQLDALEKWQLERGPQGRRVVDLPPAEQEEEAPGETGKGKDIPIGKGMCKVLLEDGGGQRCYGMEVKSIDELRVGMALGAKVQRRKRGITVGVVE
jgi:RMI1, N-terminal OB-fold domain